MLMVICVKESDRIFLKPPFSRGVWGDLHLDYRKKIPPSPP